MKIGNIKIRGHIWIENANGHLIGPGRKALLESIRNNGSIKLAAKELKMSYRHAWEMINEMNKTAPRPIVSKIVGGQNGGGTTINKDGEKLIDAFNKLQKAFEKFKKDMNKTL
ncbi:MAG: molybdenum transporter [Saprospiraceae bacterium]